MKKYYIRLAFTIGGRARFEREKKEKNNSFLLKHNFDNQLKMN